MARIGKTNRFLLILAALFVLGVLRRSDLPGEEVLPDLYRATLARPILAAAAKDHSEDVRLLRAELATAHRRIDELDTELSKTRALEAYLGKLDSPEPPRVLPGWIYSIDPDDYRRIVKITIGRRAGVRAGMPVVVGSALLGRILSVDRRIATVQCSDDSNFRIEVEIRTKAGEVLHGIAHGDGGGGLIVEYVQASKVVAKGDEVFTSAYDELIPPGLFLGSVSSADDPLEDGVLELEVKAAIPAERVAHVEVLDRTGGMR